MNHTETIAWIANFLLIASYLLVLTKKIDGEKMAYTVLILIAVTLYGSYSLIRGFYPMLALNMVNIFFGIRTIYRLSLNPEKRYNYNPTLFHIVLISAGAILAVATKASYVEIITWVGGGFFLSAYSLISSGKIKGNGFTFNAMYFAAATLYLIWGIIVDNTAIIAIEIFLIIVSLIAIKKTLVNR